MSVLDRLEQKLDKQTERLSSIDVTLARQNVTLEEHIRRTGQIEEALETHFLEDKAEVLLLKAEIAPLKETHMMWKGAAKLFTAVSAAAAAAATIAVEILHKLVHQ